MTSTASNIPLVTKLHLPHSNGKTQRSEPGVTLSHDVSLIEKFRDSDAMRSASGLRRKSTNANSSVNSSLNMSKSSNTSMNLSLNSSTLSQPPAPQAKPARPQLASTKHVAPTSNHNSYALNTKSAKSKFKANDDLSTDDSSVASSARKTSKSKRRSSTIASKKHTSKTSNSTPSTHSSEQSSARSKRPQSPQISKKSSRRKTQKASISLNTSAGTQQVDLTPLKLKLKVQQKLDKLQQSKKPKLTSPRYKSPTNPRAHRLSERPTSVSTTSAAVRNGSLSPQHRVSQNATNHAPASPSNALNHTPMDPSIMDQLDVNSLSNIFQNPEKDLINKFYSLQKHRLEKIKEDHMKEERERQYFRESEMRMLQLLKDATNTDLPLEDRLDALQNLNELEQRDLTTEGYERNSSLNTSISSTEWNNVQAKFMQHFNPEYLEKLAEQQRERERLQMDAYSFKPELNHNIDVPSRLLDHMNDPKFNPGAVKEHPQSMQQRIQDGAQISSGMGSTPKASTKKLRQRKPTESFQRLTSPPRRQAAAAAARATSPRLRTATSPVRRPLSPMPNHTLSSSTRATSPTRLAVSPIRSRMSTSSAGSSNTTTRRKLASPKRTQSHKIATPLTTRSAAEVRVPQAMQQEATILLSTAKGSFVDL